MRILVTGSRDWDEYDIVRSALAMAIYQNLPATIVHGACPQGADAIAAWWVRQMGRNLDITEERHPAEDFGSWPGCGPRRNAHMVDLGADVCLAFINPCRKRRCSYPRPHGSHGASGTAHLAHKAGIPVRLFPLRENTGGDAV
jgi:SLOG family YspA-like protein